MLPVRTGRTWYRPERTATAAPTAKATMSTKTAVRTMRLAAPGGSISAAMRFSKQTAKAGCAETMSTR